MKTERELIELRTLRSGDNKDRSLAVIVTRYQQSGKIKTYYVGEHGYVAYDPIEFANARKKARTGRPPKRYIATKVGKTKKENETK